jgi:hypothetical protein
VNLAHASDCLGFGAIVGDSGTRGDKCLNEQRCVAVSGRGIAYLKSGAHTEQDWSRSMSCQEVSSVWMSSSIARPSVAGRCPSRA